MIIQRLHNSKSPGCDNIGSKLILDAASFIVNDILHLISQ